MWILAGREIGRITVDWKDAARAYQIQVSDDATDWTTIYAKMNADASDIDIPIYANGRYVRVYCIASWAFNRFGIQEIQVFAYREGEEKCTYEIEEIPETVTGEVPDSSASYATDDVRFPMAKPPLYLEEELQMPAKPVASNDCWYDAADQRMGAIGSAVVNTQTDFSITLEGMSGATLIGLEITDADNKEKTKTAKSYFCINFPQNTSISRAGNKLKIHFEKTNAYLSVGAMTKRSDLDVFYRHGYAFVRDTSVTYRYDEDTSKVTTYFEAETQVMREGFSSETMQCLLPHQWKKSNV